MRNSVAASVQKPNLRQHLRLQTGPLNSLHSSLTRFWGNPVSFSWESDATKPGFPAALRTAIHSAHLKLGPPLTNERTHAIGAQGVGKTRGNPAPRCTEMSLNVERLRVSGRLVRSLSEIVSVSCSCSYSQCQCWMCVQVCVCAGSHCPKYSPTNMQAPLAMSLLWFKNQTALKCLDNVRLAYMFSHHLRLKLAYMFTFYWGIHGTLCYL